MTLYRTLLGKAFNTLPTPVQTFHDKGGTWTGTANIRQGAHPLARLTARQIGFPQPGENVPLSVTVTQSQNTEIWTRDFGGHVLTSRQDIEGNSLVETFGPIRVTLDLNARDDRLWITPAKWSAFGAPMPNRLLPKGDTFETADKGHFVFNVTVTAPIIGLIAAYSGQLDPIQKNGKPNA